MSKASETSEQTQAIEQTQTIEPARQTETPQPAEKAANASKAEKDRVHFFDGLRGWAALSVVFHHLLLAFPFLDFLEISPLSPFINGDFAVYIFFTLSGLVLSLGYLKTGDIGQLRGLALKRIPRLSIPIFISCIAVFVMIKAGLMLNQQAAEIVDSEWLGFAYQFDPSILDVFRFSFRDALFSYEMENSFNSSLWTIAYEIKESFLVLIVLCCLRSKKGNSRLFWIIAGLYLALVENEIARLIPIAFLLGIYLAHKYTSGKEETSRLKKIGCVAGTAAAYAASVVFGIMENDILKNLMYILAAFLTINAILAIPALQRFYSSRVSRFLGKISYPLYIVHIPVICSLTSFLVCVFGAEASAVVPIFIVSVAASIAAAWAFYPVERLSITAANAMSRLAQPHPRKPKAPLTSPPPASG